jgi:hypothetical protein
MNQKENSADPDQMADTLPSHKGMPDIYGGKGYAF